MIYTDIDRYVEKYREEAVDFLKEMIQTPSPTGEELEISKVVMKWLKRENLPVEVYAKEPTRPNIIPTGAEIRTDVNLCLMDITMFSLRQLRKRR